jgi:hypothetical protein
MFSDPWGNESCGPAARTTKTAVVREAASQSSDAGYDDAVRVGA